MLSNQIAKERQVVDAAFSYLCDPINTLGARKKSLRYPKMYFGPNNRETALLIKALNRNRRKTFWQKIVDAAEQERAKEMAPILLYSIEPPKDGEYIDNNPLTMQEFNAMIQP